jgi:hypothetical protein
MLLDRSMTNKKNYKAYFPTNQMSKDKTFKKINHTINFDYKNEGGSQKKKKNREYQNNLNWRVKLKRKKL